MAGEILHVGRPYFANLWDSAGEEGRQLLRAVAQTPAGLQKSALPADEWAEVLTRLEQYRLIEQVEGYWRVQVELTRRAFVGIGDLT